MTISTISNVGADLARIQERQNRQDAVRSATGAEPAPRPSGVADTGVDAASARDISAEENVRAAQSTLTEADFANIPSPQERVQAQAYEALTAQTNRLPPNILSLLNE